MKFAPLCLALVGFVTPLAMAKPATTTESKVTKSKPKAPTKPTKETYGQALGTQIAEQMKGAGIPLDPPFVKGFMAGFDAFAKGNRLLSKEETSKLVAEFQTQMNQSKSDDNKTKGKQYRDSLKSQKDWVTLPSGLMYKVVRKGAGPTPKATDTVETHYTGTLIDGTKFDSSRDRGTPTSFPLNQVIKGWTEGIQLMPVGSQYQFVIPPELGYGDSGAGQLIGPGATLIFDVELLSIKAK